jgi:hypothetical protein
MLQGVITGIKANEKVIDPNCDIVSDVSTLNLMNTLFTSKKL